MDDASISRLIEKAAEAKELAYCPYSKFPVGAALLGNNDKTYTGCNVENCSYPVGICAERTAIVKAVSDGCRTFKAIAVITNLDKPTTPCGLCRQTLCEFGIKIVYSAKCDKTYETFHLDHLLPHAFTPADLQ